MKRYGRALRHRNYRLFFVGQGTSLIGTWLTRFAMGYETYELSHSTWQLGLVGFFSIAPTAVVVPFAGVLVDRWSRHRTLIVTQVLAMLQSAALALFALTGLLTVLHLIVLAAVQALINAFETPSRQAFVRQMVDDRADLPNAIALNSALVNAARVLGPLVAAVLVGLVGVGGCFAIDAASYLAVIASLLAMRVAPTPARNRSSAVLRQMREGFAYVRGNRVVAALLSMLSITGVFGGAYNALLPAYAEGSLHGDAQTLGWLMGAEGVGAIIGLVYLAGRDGVAGLGRVVVSCAIALGLALVALEGVPNVWLAMPVLLVIGMAMILQYSAANTLIQSSVDEDKLGRVMSLYALSVFAGAPIGALVEGSLANVIGSVHTFALAGLGCVACALLFSGSLRSATDSTGSR